MGISEESPLTNTSPYLGCKRCTQIPVSTPFESLQKASIQSLTLKTIFLVAPASARRYSELQALGRNSPHIQFNSKVVNIRSVLGFLPKTANPEHTGETIFLPYLQYTGPRVMSGQSSEALYQN